MSQTHLIPSLWKTSDVPADPVQELVYASNLLGSDPRITNFGGGNTSSKLSMEDPLTGEVVEVLWVKGSGGDLGTAKRTGFASLYQQKVLDLEQRFVVKKMHEDDIVPLYKHCVFDGNPAAPSIDTPLHAFVPARFVSHMHSDAVIAIAASADAEALMHEVYQGQMGYLPWKRPGLELGLMLRDLIVENPGINSALMGQHGFINWADTWDECYELTIKLINEAADFIEKRRTVHPFGKVRFPRSDSPRQVLLDLLPELRGKCSFNGQRLIAKVDTSEAVLEYLEREKRDQLATLGTSCPDHFLRTKIRPLILNPGEDLDAKLADFRQAYAAYYDRCKRPDSPAMRNPNPSIVLVPGVGMVALGKNAPETRVSGEFYRNAIEVMKGAETVSRYIALPEQEAFNIEYWQLEEAKLKRQPPEKELSRQIGLVIGAGPGIGRACAERLLQEGAVVAVGDIRADLVEEAVAALRSSFGKENVIGVVLDVTDRMSVRAALDEVVLAYGGLDILVSVAAVFVPPDESGHISEEAWRKTFDINLLGSYVVADEANRIMARQGTPGSIVLMSSANAVVAKRGSFAYDTSKTALSHLVRELAVEFAPTVRVNAVAPATVVAGSLQFPRERVASSLAKYGIEVPDSATDEEMRTALAAFYAKRTLLKQPVTPARVAEAAFLLASDRLSQTTGQVLPVDAGLADAFLR